MLDETTKPREGDDLLRHTFAQAQAAFTRTFRPDPSIRRGNMANEFDMAFAYLMGLAFEIGASGPLRTLHSAAAAGFAGLAAAGVKENPLAPKGGPDVV